jgi:trehalose synthase
MSELGVETRWEVIGGDAEFFATARTIQTGLQGADRLVSDAMRQHYLAMNQVSAMRLPLDADLVLVHDAAPVSLVEHRPAGGRWVWWCHVDLSAPQRKIWRFVRPYATRFDAVVFAMPKFAARLAIPQFIVYPSIDPLSERNRDLDRREVHAVLEALGVPSDKPFLLQVGSFDTARDPLGAIDAYRIVKRHHDVRLVLAGGETAEMPDGDGFLERIREAAAADADLVVLDLPPEADVQINALQRAATVVLQKSVRDGVALTVAEAMWKGKPVVGGNTGGIPVQVVSDVTGYTVNSVAGTAYAVRHLLSNPEMIARMGSAGREHVRRNFLITRHLADYLALLTHLTGGKVA